MSGFTLLKSTNNNVLLESDDYLNRLIPGLILNRDDSTTMGAGVIAFKWAVSTAYEYEILETILQYKKGVFETENYLCNDRFAISKPSGLDDYCSAGPNYIFTLVGDTIKRISYDSVEVSTTITGAKVIVPGLYVLTSSAVYKWTGSTTTLLKSGISYDDIFYRNYTTGAATDSSNLYYDIENTPITFSTGFKAERVTGNNEWIAAQNGTTIKVYNISSEELIKTITLDEVPIDIWDNLYNCIGLAYDNYIEIRSIVTGSVICKVKTGHKVIYSRAYDTFLCLSNNTAYEQEFMLEYEQLHDISDTWFINSTDELLLYYAKTRHITASGYIVGVEFMAAPNDDKIKVKFIDISEGSETVLSTTTITARPAEIFVREDKILFEGPSGKKYTLTSGGTSLYSERCPSVSQFYDYWIGYVSDIDLGGGSYDYGGIAKVVGSTLTWLQRNTRSSLSTDEGGLRYTFIGEDYFGYFYRKNEIVSGAEVKSIYHSVIGELNDGNDATINIKLRTPLITVVTIDGDYYYEYDGSTFASQPTKLQDLTPNIFIREAGEYNLAYGVIHAIVSSSNYITRLDDKHTAYSYIRFLPDETDDFDVRRE